MVGERSSKARPTSAGGGLVGPGRRDPDDHPGGPVHVLRVDPPVGAVEVPGSSAETDGGRIQAADQKTCVGRYMDRLYTRGCSCLHGDCLGGGHQGMIGRYLVGVGLNALTPIGVLLDGYASSQQAEEVYGVKVDADGTSSPVGARLDCGR